jgi:hypothetical protein
MGKMLFWRGEWGVDFTRQPGLTAPAAWACPLLKKQKDSQDFVHFTAEILGKKDRLVYLIMVGKNPRALSSGLSYRFCT